MTTVIVNELEVSLAPEPPLQTGTAERGEREVQPLDPREVLHLFEHRIEREIRARAH